MNRPASVSTEIARLFRGVRLVVFDCDGVLFESRAANIAYYNAILASLGHPPLSPAGEAFCHRSTTGQLFGHLFADRPDLVRRAETVAAKLDYSPFFELMVPDPAARPFLETLRSRDIATAMATNRGTTVPGLFERFDLAGLFDVVVTSLDVPRPKPAPDMLLLCFSKLGVDPVAAVYLGDADVDREAARAARTRFVMVGDTEKTQERWGVRDMGELCGLVARAIR